jgi:hypothetical protein
MEAQIQDQAADRDRKALIQCRRLPASYASLGAVMDFIVSVKDFGGMEAKVLFSAVKAQIAKGHHLVAYSDQRLVGYLGWLNTTEEIARQWLANGGHLQGLPAEECDAAAITIVRITRRDAVLPIIRKFRHLHGGRRIYFKRTAHSIFGERKSSVFNNDFLTMGLGEGRAESTLAQHA